MCTVSIFFKENNDFVLTSNRDEAPNRKALPPNLYTINDTELIMPKDEISGGSWIGVSNKNRVVCLLNGGFELHQRKETYRQSRGVVVTDILSLKNIHDAQTYNFTNIEPFTLVIADWNTSLNFYEIVWDSEQAHFSQLGVTNHIWSSSTLYTEQKKETRRKWFKDLITKSKLSSKSLLKFHKTAGKGNADYGVIMDRGFVKTTSITQIEKTGEVLEMKFIDLKSNETFIKKLNFSKLIND